MDKHVQYRFSWICCDCHLPIPPWPSPSQVYIANSSKVGDAGLPFGYLKASTTLTCVNLFVMPYNYPVLLPLLDDLFKVHRLKPTKEWKARFDNYLRTMPAYYAQVGGVKGRWAFGGGVIGGDVGVCCAVFTVMCFVSFVSFIYVIFHRSLCTSAQGLMCIH